MGLDAERCRGLDVAGSLHDIGKISIPAEILSKPTRLQPAEYAIVKTHAQSGYDILKDIRFPWPIAEVARQHHERLDGSGYPQGLKGEQIIIEARILAVADVVESMGSHRPYRPARGMGAALDEIAAGRGRLYDANAVDAWPAPVPRKRLPAASLTRTAPAGHSAPRPLARDRVRRHVLRAQPLPARKRPRRHRGSGRAPTLSRGAGHRARAGGDRRQLWQAVRRGRGARVFHEQYYRFEG